MTGLELSSAMARDTATASLPIIILSARGYLLDRNDIDSSNIVEVLSKPFSPRSVIDLVQSTLEGGADRTSSLEAA